MELNTSETNISFRSVFQEEDPRILAKSYLVYKIGEFNKHVAKTKMIYLLDGFEYFPSIPKYEIIGDSKSYLSSLPRLRINVWAYFGRSFGTFTTIVQKGHHT